MAGTEGTGTGTVLIENGRVRVTEWTFAQEGDNTGWHRHAHDYVVVPLFDGQLRIEAAGGVAQIADLSHGVPYFREKGVEHDVINANAFPCRFIEVELL